MGLALFSLCLWLLLATSGWKLTKAGYSQLKLHDCSQSSNFWGGGPCGFAIDGDTNQNFHVYSCSHTNYEYSWWQAYTLRLAHIKEVKIYNRQDCCPERLNNFYISVDGRECASYDSGSSFSVKTFSCDRFGQKVEIRSRVMTKLTLCEVQVFGEFKYAQLKLQDCAQSSTHEESIWGAGRCNRAIDGKTYQNFHANSCSRTHYDRMSWWQAYTERPAHIKEVTIYNRQDCCPEKLKYFDISIDGLVCATYASESNFSVKTFTCDRSGRRVMIQAYVRTELTLCEVQVFGELKPLKPVLVPFQNCSQSTSSLDSGSRYGCHFAIDGDVTLKRHEQPGCSFIRSSPAWWSGTLDRSVDVRKVRLYNTADKQYLLTEFSILVDEKLCAEHGTTTFSEKTFECNVHGKTVKINFKNRLATLCEVQVYTLE